MVEAVGPDVRDVVVGDPRRALVVRAVPALPRVRARAGRGCAAARGARAPVGVVDGVHGYLGPRARSPRPRSCRSRRSSPIDPRVPPEVAALIGCSVATGVGAVLNTARRAGGGERGRRRLRRRRPGDHPRPRARRRVPDRRRRPQPRALRAGAGAGRARGAGGRGGRVRPRLRGDRPRRDASKRCPGLLARGGQGILVGMPAEGVRVVDRPVRPRRPGQAAHRLQLRFLRARRRLPAPRRASTSAGLLAARPARRPPPWPR